MDANDVMAVVAYGERRPFAVEDTPAGFIDALADVLAFMLRSDEPVADTLTEPAEPVSQH